MSSSFSQKIRHSNDIATVQVSFCNKYICTNNKNNNDFIYRESPVGLSGDFKKDEILDLFIHLKMALTYGRHYINAIVCTKFCIATGYM